MRAAEGSPCPQTTATGSLRASMPTAMHSLCLDSPRMRARPYPSEGSASSAWVPSARTPTRRDRRQTKIRVGARAHSLLGTHKDSAALRAALSITYLGDC